MGGDLWYEDRFPVGARFSFSVTLAGSQDTREPVHKETREPVHKEQVRVERVGWRSMLAYNIHHVAIAVESLDDTIAGYETLYNVTPESREVVEDQGVSEAMIAIGGSYVQLLEPLTPESPVGRFLSRNGEGLHHIAFAVNNIEDALLHLKENGATLIDESPRLGGGGNMIAFVHPKELAGTLIELVEVGDA